MRSPQSWPRGRLRLPIRLFSGALSIFALLSLGVSCAGGPSSRASGDPEERSVLAGELLAIFPGFFVHGMGHRYAGNKERADELLLMEGYSALTAGLGGGLAAVGAHEDLDALEVTGWVGVGVGGVGFLGSWLYDVIFTPSEVKRYNRSRRSGD